MARLFTSLPPYQPSWRIRKQQLRGTGRCGLPLVAQGAIEIEVKAMVMGVMFLAMVQHFSSTEEKNVIIIKN